MRWCRIACIFILVGLFVACGSNPHRPRDNSVGQDRIEQFNRAAEWVLAHTVSGTLSMELPKELKPDGCIRVHVANKGRAVAFEFPSEPIDSNPIYIFVAASEPAPGDVVEQFVRDNTHWHGQRKLDEPGWYLAYGL